MTSLNLSTPSCEMHNAKVSAGRRNAMEMEVRMQESDVLIFEKMVDEHFDVVNMPHQPEISG